jgi:hypothetical protein
LRQSRKFPEAGELVAGDGGRLSVIGGLQKGKPARPFAGLPYSLTTDNR